MTLTALPSPIALAPNIGSTWGSTATTSIGSQNTMTFNAAGDKVALVFQAISTTAPDIVSFVVSGAATPGTTGDIEATLETLATDGTPSGTPVSSSATGSATISTTGVKTISGMVGTATLVQGTQYAVVLTAGSGWDRTLTIGTFVGSNSNTGMPYMLSKDTAGAWGKLQNGITGFQMGIAASGGTYMYIPGVVGGHNPALQSFSNSTNPDERGNVFTLAVPATCIGLICAYNGGSAPGNADAFSVRLYSDPTGSPTVLASQSIDGDAQTSGLPHAVYFDAAVDLSASTQYAVTFKADSTDSAALLRFDYETGNNALLGSHCGTSFYEATRNDLTGAFSTVDYRVYAVYPIFSKMDNGAGGGGGLAANPIRGFIG